MRTTIGENYWSNNPIFKIKFTIIYALNATQSQAERIPETKTIVQKELLFILDYRV